MDMSPDTSAIFAALPKAQAEVENATKDATGARSKYATLAAVMDACKGALNSHGLAVLQLNEPCEPGHIRLRTVLTHESGQWISGTLVMPATKEDPQIYGSAMTYARRYALAAMVGVCPEDDDAESAKPRPAQQQRQQAPAPTGPKPISEGQLKWIHAFFTRNEITDRTVALEMVSGAAGRKVDSTTTLTGTEATRVIDVLTKKETA